MAPYCEIFMVNFYLISFNEEAIFRVKDNHNQYLRDDCKVSLAGVVIKDHIANLRATRIDTSHHWLVRNHLSTKVIAYS